MILTCPNCNSQFNVPDGIFDVKGRKVKCSSCSEVWFQEKIDEESKRIADPFDEIDSILNAENSKDDSLIERNQDESDQEIEEDGFSAALRSGGNREDFPSMVKIPIANDELSDTFKKPFMQEKAVRNAYLASGAIFLIVFIYFLARGPVILERNPNAIVVYGMLGYSLDVPGENLVFDQIQVKKHDGEIVVEGNIENLGREAQKIPMIEAQLRNSKEEVVDVWRISTSKELLDAESSISFLSVYKPKDPKAIDEKGDVKIRFIITKKAQSNTALKDADNTQALPEGDQVHPSAHEEVSESPQPVSDVPHSESSHQNLDSGHSDSSHDTDAPEDHAPPSHH